jgi:hypothetical protein
MYGAAGPSASIHETVAALEAIRSGVQEGDLPYDVPQDARPLLTQLKHQLRDLIVHMLNAPQIQALDADRLTAEVLKELEGEHVPVGENRLPKSQQYGGILDVKITRPKGNRDLLAATVTLQVPCSKGDTALYILKREPAGWQLVMAVESNNYPQVDGVQDHFEYVISPRDQQGDWYVVAAHIPGWCTSCFSVIDYQVLRPGPTPGAPKVLLKRDQDVYRCDDPPYKLALEPAGFRMDYVALWLDQEVFSTIQPDRYVVSSDQVTRIPPVAYTPQDFVNAWAQMRWNEALRWSNPARVASLKGWHDRFQPGGDKGYLFASKLEFVQPCNNPPTKWQIGLTADKFDAKSPRLFFTVSLKGDAFNLQGIDEQRPPGCPGEAPASQTLDWERLEQLPGR